MTPWTRINVLGGVNNSGKTALLQGVSTYIPSLLNEGKLRFASNLQRAPLDAPQHGAEPPSLMIGAAVDFGSAGVANGLYQAIRGEEGSYSDPIQISQVLSTPQFLDARGFASTPDTCIRWFWFTSQGQLSVGQSEALESHPDAASALRQITGYGYSGEVSWTGVLNRLLPAVGAYQRVVTVPPIRQITVTDHRANTLPSTSGEGLAGMLLSLIAPQAVDFRAARHRLDSINAFVSTVLGRRSELLVPHDGTTVHVAMEDRVLPLSHLGAGIEQIVLLAAICTEYRESLVLMEEPDLFLHPTMQRQLLAYLRVNTDNTYLIATHSAAMLDTDFANVFKVDWTREAGTQITLISRPSERSALATALGFRASDLVQANAIIWVEGPSDRILVKRWLQLKDPRLTEGVHYSFVLYGGRLAEHLSAAEFSGSIDERMIDQLLEIARINRHAVFMMDSDLTASTQILAGYKTRITKAFSESLDGISWTTAGTMIENYLDPDVFAQAYRAVHPRKEPTYTGGLKENPFAGGVKQPNKVAIAERAAELTTAIAPRGDLPRRMDEVVQLLRRVNDLPAL